MCKLLPVNLLQHFKIFGSMVLFFLCVNDNCYYIFLFWARTYQNNLGVQFIIFHIVHFMLAQRISSHF